MTLSLSTIRDFITPVVCKINLLRSHGRALSKDLSVVFVMWFLSIQWLSLRRGVLKAPTRRKTLFSRASGDQGTKETPTRRSTSGFIKRDVSIRDNGFRTYYRFVVARFVFVKNNYVSYCSDVDADVISPFDFRFRNRQMQIECCESLDMGHEAFDSVLIAQRLASHPRINPLTKRASWMRPLGMRKNVESAEMICRSIPGLGMTMSWCWILTDSCLMCKKVQYGPPPDKDWMACQKVFMTPSITVAADRSFSWWLSR